MKCTYEYVCLAVPASGSDLGAARIDSGRHTILGLGQDRPGVIILLRQRYLTSFAGGLTPMNSPV